jgi:hypothetical protein
LVTEGFFQRFYEFENRVLIKHLEQAKICWAMNPDRFRQAIGDSAFEFLVDNIDLDLQDYGIHVYPQPVDYENLKNFIMQAVSAGMPAHVGLKVMRIAVFNIEQAIDMFYEEEEKRKQQMMDQQQQIAAEANASNERIAAAQLQRAQVPAQITADAKLAATQMQVEGSTRNTQLKGQNEQAASGAKQATEVFKSSLALQEAELGRQQERELATQQPTVV